MNKQIISIQEAYSYCESIIKKHSRSFYYAFSSLPDPKAKAVYAIYAFCRIADDSVDDESNKLTQLRLLNELEMTLQSFESGSEINHPLWIALKDVFQRYNMNIEPFYNQLKGQRMDVHFSAPKTMEQLETYSYLVAGTVGEMLLPIIASESEEDLTEEAVNLGIAMQLTNILRDIGEDYRDKSRIYLPASFMRKENYSPMDIHHSVVNKSFITIWEQIAARAENLYDTFQEKIKSFDEDSQLPVLVASHIYRGILQAVRENDYNCFKHRSFVPKMEMHRIQQQFGIQ